MVHSTSALAISDRSLALRMRRYPGLWEPGATTIVSSTPAGHSKTTAIVVGVQFKILQFNIAVNIPSSSSTPSGV